ncbi:MAG: hypothetical protein HYV33_04190 [Candidatus Kerfeldbacteria bacterium]|nr:hypothetical protein [Candidatus Kerfeldbacteria bacterium]
MSFSTHSTVPIELLPGIGRRTARVLRSLGIATIGQFKQLPERVLIELFGPSIRLVHSYVHGQAVPTVNTEPTTTLRRSLTQRLRLASQMMALL